MNALTLLLQGATPAGGGFFGGGKEIWIMLIAMFAIMYFFMIRPQNKKQKEISNFRKSLQVNQHVVTAGGIFGVIKEITDNYVVLEIASNVKIKIDKNSLYADNSSAAGAQQSK
ncbi:MAG: preprotein translocase subunit YajC [Mediterranea sp.]|jgi:preprotein translocase subunit YajC|nr:preprotein translocase subunit YajC [Mediterranea sp.]